jgi:Zn-dependent M28 family amino/carboxypeptidase
MSNAEEPTPKRSEGGTDWIGETFVSDAGWDHLETLVDLPHRMAGTEGERRGAEATRDALERVGARDARIEEFPIQGWERGESAIEAGGENHHCIALPRSSAGSVSGELVDLGYGLPAEFDADLEGTIVMVASDVPDHFDRFIHRREKYYRAVEAGVAGFLFRNHVPGGLPPTGSVGTPEEPIGEVPAVGVSKEVGARLSRRFESEEVGIDVEATIGEVTSRNVHAELGPESEREVLVTCHVDAHDIAEGAMDNGAGTAAVVEIARALASREAELETGVRFLVFGAEEVGLLGAKFEADRMDPGSIKAILNNDGVCRGRTLSLYTHGFPELESVVGDVADRMGHPIETTPEQGPHSDHWPFVVRGVPGYHAMSETGDRGRGWGHTEADTIDKLEGRTLRESAIVLTELAVELADGSVEIGHREPEEIAAALEREDQAEGMKLIGDWPF